MFIDPVHSHSMYEYTTMSSTEKHLPEQVASSSLEGGFAQQFEVSLDMHQCPPLPFSKGYNKSCACVWYELHRNCESKIASYKCTTTCATKLEDNTAAV